MDHKRYVKFEIFSHRSGVLIIHVYDLTFHSLFQSKVSKRGYFLIPDTSITEELIGKLVAENDCYTFVTLGTEVSKTTNIVACMHVVCVCVCVCVCVVVVFVNVAFRSCLFGCSICFLFCFVFQIAFTIHILFGL